MPCLSSLNWFQLLIMIDEQRQALTFQKSYNQFKTLFKITPQDESLQIKVDDTQGFARYDLKVTQGYMSEHPEYNCFRDPIDIFDFVSQHFEKVVVEGNYIKFQYIWGFSLKKTRDVVLILNEQEMDHAKLAHIKIDNLIKEIRQKDGFIASLQQKINKKNIQFEQKLSTCLEKIEALNETVRVNAELQQLIKIKQEQRLKSSIQIVNSSIKNNLQALDNKCVLLQDNLKILAKQMEEVNLLISKTSDRQLEQNESLRQSCKKTHLAYLEIGNEVKKELEGRFQPLAKEIVLLRKGFKESIKPMVEEPKILESAAFGNHKGNSHSQFYQIKKIGSSVILTRIGTNSKWYTFVNKNPISIFQKNRFKVKIRKLTNNDLSVGFCTNAGLGNLQSYSSSECIYYWCKNGGEIWKLGGQKLAKVGVSSEGDTVECQLSLGTGVMGWWKNGVKLTESEIPPEMNGKPIYFSVILYYTNDSIDLTV